MKRLFGTDGVRGVANAEPMTVETSLKLGRAAAHVFKGSDRRHRIVIGKDTRLSGYMLENALVAGICSMGVDVLLIGPMPTPGTAFITRSLRADAGIMISASHNPYEDNGIKFFSQDGFKLPDSIEKRMEELIFTGAIDAIRPTARDVGKAYRIDDAAGRYVEFVKNSFPKGMTLDGFRVVLDCANGAAYRVAPRVLIELGAEVAVHNDDPDGTNINDRCGSLYPELIQGEVIAHGAHLGVSLDGDADRVILSDEKGNVVDGDYVMAICSLDLLSEDRLPGNTLVSTVMSNLGLERAIEKAGGRMVRTRVGDRYVLEEMLKRNAILGGEQSGHIIFRDYTTTGDGLISVLQVLRIMNQSGKPLSELCRCMERFPQVLLNVRVKEKRPLEELAGYRSELDAARESMGENGRILVRYSGTEPIARVMVEGREESQIREVAGKIAACLERELG